VSKREEESVERGEAGFQEAHTRKSGFKGGKSARPERPAQPPIHCPSCASQRVWKDGLRHLRDGETVQRYLCRSCGFRFSSQPKVKVHVSTKRREAFDPRSELLDTGVVVGDFPIEKAPDDSAFSFREDVGSHKLTSVGKDLNTFPSYNSKRRVCVSEDGAKNLAEEATRIEKWAAGATRPDLATVKGKLVEFAWHLQKEGYKPYTIRRKVKTLRWLIELGGNIFDPENIKEVIAKKQGWSDATKAIVCDDYATFLEMQGLTWKRPMYRGTSKMPFIPLESEIDALINASGKNTGAFLQGLKDTGADPGELAGVEWTDINAQSKTVMINRPVKGHNPRVLLVSDEFLRRVNSLKKHGKRVFNLQNVATTFYEARKNIARKLNNPRINEISLTTLRHWKGTMEYHKTKDPYHVKKILGHKRLQSTEIYINLELALFLEQSNDFHVKTAETKEEITALLEVGFEYVCQKEGLMFFRKRK